MYTTKAFLPYSKVPALPQLLKAYVERHPKLDSLYDYFPDVYGIENAIRNRTHKDVNREILACVLLEQHIAYQDKKNQIATLLQKNTFTITTGHQLCLFTGPLYFIYKILTVLKLAKQLSAQFPKYHFVPLFWMASEDHDFSEVNHTTIFQKKIIWEKETALGAIGRMSTDGIKEAVEIAGIDLGNWLTHYSSKPTMAEATKALVYAIFESFPELLVLDADHTALKQQATKLWLHEIEHTTQTLDLVNASTSILEKAGFDAQIHARDTNLFYLDQDIRDRILRDGTTYRAAHIPSLSWKSDQLIEIIQRQAQKISPNVVLRPLYQEMILPNIMYVGGPAEIHYWLQLKALFAHLNVFFPVLMPRCSILLISKAQYSKLEKWNIPIELLMEEDRVIKKWVAEKQHPEAATIHTEWNQVLALFDTIKSKFEYADKTLVAWVESEKHQAIKQGERISHKLLKAVESKSEVQIQQILTLKYKLFPNNGLQERSENIFTYILNNPNIVDDIYRLLEPLQLQWQIIAETE